MMKRKRELQIDPLTPTPPSKYQIISSTAERGHDTVSLTPEDYTVGIICALPIEMAAVSAVLDSRHRGLPVRPSDHNTYTLGKIGPHNTVIACLPAGVYGTTSAAVVASNLLISFPSIRVGLLVGIGGGAPSNADIRLGDVVVSKPTAGSGGVVQYDYGKAVSSGHLLRTGMLNKPPQILLTAISKLQSDHMLRGSGLSERLSELAKKSSMFAHPGQDIDRLFHANYEHSDGQKACDECESRFLVARARRANDLPIIHYGLIASGNQVLKHAGTRDRLAKELNILCFEMEAAGMMDHFPCLVIRGICDYSDSHKNKEWQTYAAATAAAYARELLSIVPGRQIETTPAFSATSPNPELVYRVSQWLTPMDFSAIQRDIISKRQEGTGEWLLKSAEYVAWLRGMQPTLFCHGIPGVGKTMMSSIVIQDIQMRFGDDGQVGIAYLYFNFKRPTEQSPTDMFASLLKQLVEEWPALPEALETLYEYHIRRGTRPVLYELTQMLLQIIGRFRKVFWIIDALDECADTDGARTTLLREIGRLQKQTTISLFVTSRPNPEIQSQFQGRLSMEIRASDKDIQRYLADQMPRLPLCVSQDPELQGIIKDEIVRAADGMFLLAQLHIDSLYDKTTRKSIRRALKELPEGIDELDDAYESAMLRITSQKYGFQKLARRVLLWITCAKRPLTTQELRHALAVEISEPEIDDENLTEVADMVSVCAGLVTIDQESNIIRLVHYTTQDYFQRTQRTWFPDAETEVAAVCIAYLSFSAFAPGHCYTDENFESRVEENRLFLYAACNWGHHARETSTVLDETVLDFLENEARMSSSTQAMTISSKKPGYSQDIPQHVTGLHLAAYFGLTNALSTLLKNGHYPDREDTYGRTPLSWAAGNGQEASTKLLLASKRADPGSKDKNGESPLCWAAKLGHVSTLQAMLDKGADPNIPNALSQTPLSLAAQNGHTIAVKLLLRRGADANFKDRMSMSPLAWAACRGHSTVADVLLKQANIEPDLKHHSGQTPLSLAASEGHTGVLKHFLITHMEIDPNSRDDRGRSPLSWAAAKGHEAAVTLLLQDYRVDPDLPDKHGQTPLSLAAANGRATVTELLLANNKVNPVSVSEEGQTPLCFAAMHGHVATVKVLLTKCESDSIVPDVQDDCGRTSLLWAAKNGHESVVKALLATGRVNISLKDKGGHTSYDWARKNGHHAIVRLLVHQ